MKYKKYVIIIIILMLILVGIIIAYLNQNSNNTGIDNYDSLKERKSTSSSTNNEGENNETKTTLKSNSEIKSALVENIEPHASYYLEEVCVEQNQFVEKGSNILKYTNGTYLTAPYDCIVTELNLPGEEGKILNSHYVGISSNNVLATTISVDETNINKVKVGLEAKIKVSTLEKEYTGNVTKVASTAENGKFSVTIEFENDGNIKLGMTANVEITI